MIESRRVIVLLVCFIAVTFGGFSSLTFGQLPIRQFTRTTNAASYVPDEVLVTFKSEATAQMRSDTISGLGDRSMSELLGTGGYVRVKLPPGRAVEDAMSRYRATANVESVQPNYIYRALKVPNDAQYGQLWALKNIGQSVATGTYTPTHGTAGDDMNIEPAWDYITDCAAAVVAVVDTGVNYNQEDLAANMWNGNAHHGWDFVDNDSDPMDLNGHGTHVAGIIGAAGNDGVGTSGVCWKASIMAVRVLDATGVGTTAGIIQGINFAVTNGAKVINMSLGGAGAFDQAFSNAITTAQSGDVVVVVAAGNDGGNNDVNGNATFPCNFTQLNLVCVAALDQNYSLATFSNFGATSVDVGAPGANILSSFAGTVVSTSDTLSSGWTISNGWTHALNNGNDWLFDPAGFLVTKYGPGLNDTATKGFNTSAANAIVLNFSAAINLADGGDSIAVGVDETGVNAFGTILGSQAGPLDTSGIAFPVSLDISRCAGQANCLIGFRLATGPSTPGDYGIGITGFSIQTLMLNASTYQIENGTSMASPEAAGVATMLRAFNPQYTYADVVNAIKIGGRTVAALAGKTTTGKAVDAMGALAYINPPTGVTAVIVP